MYLYSELIIFCGWEARQDIDSGEYAIDRNIMWHQYDIYCQYTYRKFWWKCWLKYWLKTERLLHKPKTPNSVLMQCHWFCAIICPCTTHFFCNNAAQYIYDIDTVFELYVNFVLMIYAVFLRGNFVTNLCTFWCKISGLKL